MWFFFPQYITFDGEYIWSLKQEHIWAKNNSFSKATLSILMSVIVISRINLMIVHFYIHRKLDIYDARYSFWYGWEWIQENFFNKLHKLQLMSFKLQGSKGIRQLLINCCTHPKVIHKVTPLCQLQFAFASCLLKVVFSYDKKINGVLIIKSFSAQKKT